MMQLPCTKQGLIRLVRICQHLTDNLEIYNDDDLGQLDIGPVYEIETTGLTRLEVLDKVGRYLNAEIKACVTLGEVPHLKDIESLVDIVIDNAQNRTVIGA
jgi:ethanolamine ammonia-lyase small subunit